MYKHTVWSHIIWHNLALYVFDRLIGQPADVNSQSSVGMFFFSDGYYSA